HCLSWLKRPLRRTTSTRRRRGNPLSHFAAQLSLTQLEDRCLLSSSVLGTELLVNTPGAGNSTNPALAVERDGSVVTAWSADASGASNIFVRRNAIDGSPLGPPQQINVSAAGPLSNVAVAISVNDQVVVTWEGGSGVFAAMFDRDLNPLKTQF